MKSMRDVPKSTDTTYEYVVPSENYMRIVDAVDLAFNRQLVLTKLDDNLFATILRLSSKEWKFMVNTDPDVDKADNFSYNRVLDTGTHLVLYYNDRIVAIISSD